MYHQVVTIIYLKHAQATEVQEEQVHVQQPIFQKDVNQICSVQVVRRQDYMMKQVVRRQAVIMITVMIIIILLPLPMPVPMPMPILRLVILISYPN